MKPITYLHFSILGDAPKVANQLVKYGTDVWEGGGDYPDIMPLYLAIANPQGTKNLGAALRIASSYALSRTCEYLLSRGADPNCLSRFGLAAIHLAVRSRPRWRNFGLLVEHLAMRIGSNYENILWRSMLASTASALLRFGADPNLRSATSRVHVCGQKCWCSPDCEHQGQAVLHFACGSGQRSVVSLLLKHGADPKTADDDGYLPLFSALCQDHHDVALQLLQDDVNPANPIIVQPYQSTALHVSCRFASVEVVSLLLERGADPNVADRVGQTPLHELLGQGCWELQDRILEILPLLDTYGVVADVKVQGGMTARQIAAAHPFSSIREFFDSADSDDDDISSNRFQIPYSNFTGPSARASGTFPRVNHRQGVHPDMDSRESFPLLSRLPADQEGIKQAPMLDSVWLNKKTTEQLRTRPSPSTNHGQVKDEKRSHKGAKGSLVVQDDRGKSSPVVRSAEDFRMSSSAKFWGSLSSSQKKPNHPEIEKTHEEREADVADGAPRRKGRKKQWIRVDLP